jgi:zinc transporter 9
VFSVGAHLAALSVFGNGLLLGAALGIVIPEGVEALGESARGEDFPTPRLALALLAGFAFMLIVEQFVGSHSHSSTNGPESVALHARKSTDDVEFDADVEALDDPPVQPRPRESHSDSEASARKRAYPLTLGLCMHGLTDGLALGASAFSSTGADADLSFIVFLALAVHKAPTSLALTTSLLSTSLSHSDCKKHIALFSAATPIGALISYGLFFFLGTKAEWTGLALLVSVGPSDHTRGQ